MTCHVATRTGRITHDIRKAGQRCNAPGHGRTRVEGSTMATVQVCPRCGETFNAYPKEDTGAIRRAIDYLERVNGTA